MPCFRCGRMQEDPVKGASPWARAIVADEQVLVCPECQGRFPDWASAAERCRRCASTRLQIQVGMHVCRACGEFWEAAP